MRHFGLIASAVCVLIAADATAWSSDTLRKIMPTGLAPSGSIKLFKEPDSKQA